jgi:hypothetical protein
MSPVHEAAKSTFLFSPDQLPRGFRYPDIFLKIISVGPLPDIEPWWFLCIHEETALFWLTSLKAQYPSRTLVPFAKLEDSDDVACFDGTDTSGSPAVKYVHAFASAGWEDRGEEPDFSSWLVEAHALSKEWREKRISGD